MCKTQYDFSESNMIISCFKNIKLPKEKDIDFYTFANDIKTGKYKLQIEKLRTLADKEKKLFKSRLPAVTLSGTFDGQHKTDKLIHYSGLIQIDIDNTENLIEIKNILYSDKYTFCGFVSPSGKGLKLVIKIPPDNDLHKMRFSELELYYNKEYGIAIDKACKDVSRLCFVSYDPELFINEQAEIFTAYTTENNVKLPTVQTANPKNDYFYNVTNFEEFVFQIEQQKINFAHNYDDWLKIGFAISKEFGLNGFAYFNRISKISSKYDYETAKQQYDNCLKANNGNTEIKTVFSMAKKAGLKKTNTSNNIVLVQKNSMKNNTAKLFHKGNFAEPSETTNKLPINLIKEYIIHKYDIRNNEILLDIEWKEKNQEHYVQFNENQLYIELLENGYKANIQLITSLVKSNFVKKYNPFLEYLNELPKWDGQTDHIARLASFLKIKETSDFKFLYHFKKWFIRLVRCMLDEQYFNKQMLVFVQEVQNGGKSTFCRFLTPQKLKKYYTETIATGKDEDIQLATNFLICYDELSKLTKTDIQQIKSLMSRLNVNIRRPYERIQSVSNRRCSFIGNTNKVEFLNDETGSIRFLCFELESIDFEYSNSINIDDIYSQAYSLYLNNEPHEITKEDCQIIQHYNKRFSVTTPEQELILKYFSPSIEIDPKVQYKTQTEIQICLHEKAPEIKLNNTNVGKALKYLGFEQITKRLDSGYPQKVYIIKPNLV